MIRVLAPTATALLLLLGGGPAPAANKAPLPTILLYPATPGDVAALVDLRTRLRLDSRVSVLTYDPESAAIQRASAEDAHPEWLVSAPTTDSGRMFLARALGAAFYAVVSPGRATDSTHVELVETAPAARTFDWTGSNRQFGVRAIESQVADSVAHPAAYDTANPPVPSVTPPAVVAAAPAPAVVAAAPAPAVVAAAPAPAVVAAAPAPAVVAAAPAPAVVAAAPAPAVVAAAPAPAVVAAAPAPAVVAAAPAPAVVAAAPAPAVVAAAPAPAVVAAAPAPAVVAAAPAPTPTIIAIPKPVLPATPTPLALPPSAVVPLNLPTQVAQNLPVTLIPPPALPVAPVPLAVPPKAAIVPLNLPTQVAQNLPVTIVPALPKVADVPPVKTAPPVVAVTSPVGPPKEGTQMAMLPKPVLPVPLQPAPVTLSPAPPVTPLLTAKPAAPAVVRKSSPKTEDISAVQPLLSRGDSALDNGDAVGAIAFYRQAINGAPLSIVPRLKLAQAYQKDGLSDRALDEARRALQIAPDNLPVQQFLSDLDQQTGTSAGTLVRDRALLERNPGDPAAHATLADTLWNNGDLSGAEAEYKAAQALAPAGNHAADAQLAQLYAAEARYDDCLTALATAGKGGYALAIQIVKNRAETLSSTLSTSRDTFSAGKSTREQFYDDAKKLSAEAQALAGFVDKVTPPAEYKISHLHRKLSTNLLAQEAATLVTFIETADSRQNDSISLLEKAAATEMLTAQATEEKLGLWKEKPN